MCRTQLYAEEMVIWIKEQHYRGVLGPRRAKIFSKMISSEIPKTFQPTNIFFQIHIRCNKTNSFRMFVEALRYLDFIYVANVQYADFRNYLSSVF